MTELCWDDIAYSPAFERWANRLFRLIPTSLRFRIAWSLSCRTRWCWASLVNWAMDANWSCLRDATESRCHENQDEPCWCGKYGGSEDRQ